MRNGLIYIFTGDGKGKTSAALGVAMRAVGQGKRVAMVQWYKERRWNIGEHNLPDMLVSTKRYNPSAGGVQKGTRREIGRFKIYPMGQGFYKLPTDHATQTEHKKAAVEAMEMARKLLEEKHDNKITGCQDTRDTGKQTPANLPTSKPASLFLLILDEALNAVNDKLLALPDLLALLELRGPIHIILTGRNAPKKLIDLADLVTEMKNIKHPYDVGQKAVMGLDY